MLFLAVFCGFLAENQREHMVEHQREKQFMKLLIRDLAKDTITIQEDLPYKKERIAAIDSLFDYFYVHKEENTIPSYVHNLLRRSSWDRGYLRNTATITQLKNSGAMRLVRNHRVADSLLEYDFLWERADKYYSNAQIAYSEMINDYITKTLNDFDLLPYYKANTTGGARLPEGALITIRINTTYLIELMNHLHKVKATINNQLNFYSNINNSAKNLIQLIKKEYPLK